MKLIINDKGQKVLLDDEIGIILEEQIKCPIIVDPNINEEYEEYEILFDENVNSVFDNPEKVFESCLNCNVNNKELCNEIKSIFLNIFQEKRKEV